jgi:hypothetical protein
MLDGSIGNVFPGYGLDDRSWLPSAGLFSSSYFANKCAYWSGRLWYWCSVGFHEAIV